MSIELIASLLSGGCYLAVTVWDIITESGGRS